MNEVEATPNVRQRIVEFQEQHPLAATMIETAAVWAGRAVLKHAVEYAAGVRLGHGWHNTRVGRFFQQPVVAASSALVAAPLAEEFLLRKTPSDILDAHGQQGMQRGKGVLIALAFASGHAGKEALPVPQFIGGLNYWRVMRARGYRSAVTAHATHNALSLAGSLRRRLHT